MSERMLFCLGEGKYETKGIGYQKNYHIFNKPVSVEDYNKAMSNKPSFILPVAIWIYKEKMTDLEKKNKTNCSELGGYLKVLSQEDAWKEGWANASKEFKDWVLGLPNFSAEIFNGITGLDINEQVEELTVADIEKLLNKRIKIIK